jgi:hypothetical protein
LSARPGGLARAAVLLVRFGGRALVAVGERGIVVV